MSHATGAAERTSGTSQGRKNQELRFSVQSGKLRNINKIRSLMQRKRSSELRKTCSRLSGKERKAENSKGSWVPCLCFSSSPEVEEATKSLRKTYFHQVNLKIYLALFNNQVTSIPSISFKGASMSCTK